MPEAPLQADYFSRCVARGRNTVADHRTLTRRSIVVSIRACNRPGMQMPLLDASRVSPMGRDPKDICAKGEQA